MAEKLIFAQKGPKKTAGACTEAWNVLVVDDDAEVHAVTRLALRSMRHRGRPLNILSAHSAAEAREILAARTDIAIILLDVVMETDDAGLRLVRHIRDVIGNRFVRIILRTGQPGQAPEESVIVNYDINDYKAKTELTAQKLFTATLTALRAYDDIMALEMHRRGLRRIIESTDSLFKLRSLQQFSAGVLMQLGSLLGVGANGILCVQRSPEGSAAPENVYVLAASDGYAARHQTPLSAVTVDHSITENILKVFEKRTNLFGEDFTVLYLGDERGEDTVAYLHCPPPREEMTADLVELFCSKIAVGFSNLYLYEELEQKVQERTLELEDANRILALLANTDPLTNAHNRRFFEDNAAREMARARRGGGSLALLVLDIDHFKQVNDTHGHAAGDQVLCAVVERVRGVLRASDLLGRMGGEEFAVLLPETDAAGATIVAEKLRTEIAASAIPAEGVEIAVTTSVGIAELLEGEAYDALYSRADAALYAAKRQGRNRVVVA